MSNTDFKYRKQLYRHNPELEIMGDCYRTCFSNIFCLEPWEVPHFNIYIDPDEEVEKFLNKNRHKLYHLHCGGDINNALSQLSALAPGHMFIFSGESRTGVNHAVLAKDGKIVFDPSLDDSGIIGPIIGQEYFFGEFILEEITPQIKAIYDSE